MRTQPLCYWGFWPRYWRRHRSFSRSTHRLLQAGRYVHDVRDHRTGLKHAPSLRLRAIHLIHTIYRVCGETTAWNSM